MWARRPKLNEIIAQWLIYSLIFRDPVPLACKRLVVHGANSLILMLPSHSCLWIIFLYWLHPFFAVGCPGSSHLLLCKSLPGTASLAVACWEGAAVWRPRVFVWEGNMGLKKNSILKAPMGGRGWSQELAPSMHPNQVVNPGDTKHVHATYS